MGLTSQYQTQQKKVTDENEKMILNFNRTKSLNKAIPNNLLIDFYGFFLLFLSGDGFDGQILYAFWKIFGNFGGIFQCL